MTTTNSRDGKVFLVGAGPGDPGLLTLRAAEVLRQADVLLYDALASDAVVNEACASCERIFVGKRGGNHAMPQSEIEALLVRKAREGKRVVRLKGGDPFVFGRGGEEAEVLHAAGIAFEVVPGITSAIAAPAYAGIPITHREHNTAFTVVTGHEDPGKPESTIDWQRLADPHQTLVLLMAIGNLRDIAARLIACGLPPSRPVAVIRDGTRPTQRTLVGTLETIADDVERAALTAPAVVVIGGVVALRERIAWFERSPLFGKRVLVTRPAHQNEDFANALLRAGAQPVLAPSIRIVPPDDPAAAERAAQRAPEYAWIVFTSANGVHAFFKPLQARREDARALGGAKVAAIGLKTAQALLHYHVYADLVPHAFVAEHLAQALIAASKSGDRILIYRAAQARDVLPQLLQAADRIPDVVAAYKTEVTHDPGFAAIAASCDVLTFTSASTVRGFVENAGGADAAAQLARDKTVACIGPICAQAAQEYGLHVDAIADEYTADGLLAALQRRLTTTA